MRFSKYFSKYFCMCYSFHPHFQGRQGKKGLWIEWHPSQHGKKISAAWEDWTELKKKKCYSRKRDRTAFALRKGKGKRDKGKKGSRTELAGEHSSQPALPVLWCKCSRGSGPSLLSPGVSCPRSVWLKPSSATPGKAGSTLLQEEHYPDKKHHVLEERRDNPPG